MRNVRKNSFQSISIIKKYIVELLPFIPLHLTGPFTDKENNKRIVLFKKKMKSIIKDKLTE